jgi:hypothetical protein
MGYEKQERASHGNPQAYWEPEHIQPGGVEQASGEAGL